MQSIIHHQFGEPVDVLELGEMPKPEPKAGETMQLSSGDLIFKQATVKGFWASVVNKEMPAERKKALFVELLTLATQKKLVLPVEGVFSFDDIKTAALKATQGARQGKVLLKP